MGDAEKLIAKTVDAFADELITIVDETATTLRSVPESMAAAKQLNRGLVAQGNRRIIWASAASRRAD